MSVLKVIEIMGDSEKGWEQAAQEAVTDAAIVPLFTLMFARGTPRPGSRFYKQPADVSPLPAG